MNRTVLVTGAAGGIGRLTVERFAAAGWQVFATDRATAAICAGPNVTPLALDVTDDASVAAVAAQIPALDALINNAGVGLMGPITEMTDADTRLMLEVNVLGPMRVARAFVPKLSACRGRIVNVGSLAGIVTLPFLGAYCASKHAVEAVTDAMRLELKPRGIGVALVQPSVVNTGFVEKAMISLNGYAASSDAYRAQLERTAALQKALHRTELDPRAVAATVFRAATTRWPRARYTVGAMAVFLIRLMQWLPTRVGDAVLRSALRLNPGMAVPS